MKVGIIGLPQTGKKTLFQILTGNEIADPAKAFKPVPGTADILDSRFDRLVEMYAPKKMSRRVLIWCFCPKWRLRPFQKGIYLRIYPIWTPSATWSGPLRMRRFTMPKAVWMPCAILIW